MSRKNPTESKLTSELRKVIKAQLRRRKYVESWSKIAKRHKISRRNLNRHVAAISRGAK
jgi:hypothetical protein